MTNIKTAGHAILEGIPERIRARYHKRALKAPTSLTAALQLKCLDCCAWEYEEVKRCHITACSLHAHRARLFNQETRKGQAGRVAVPEKKMAETA